MDKYQIYSKEVGAMLPRAVDLGIFRENSEEKNNPKMQIHEKCNSTQCSLTEGTLSIPSRSVT